MNGKRGKGSRRKGKEEEDEDEEEGGAREGGGGGGERELDSGGNTLPLSSLPPLSIFVPPSGPAIAPPPAFFALAAYIESRAPSENRCEEEKREEVELGLPACWSEEGGGGCWGCWGR